MKFSFAKKTTLAFSALSTLCLAIGGIGIVSSQSILADLKLYANNVLPATDYLLQLDRDMHQSLIAQLKMSDSQGSEAKEHEATARENIQQVQERWEKFKDSASIYTDRSIHEREVDFEADFLKWQKTSFTAIDLLNQSSEEKRAEGLALINGEALQHFDTARDHIDKLTEILEVQARKTSEGSVAAASKARITVIIVVLVSVLIGILMTWKIGYKIGKQLKKIAESLSATADNTSSTSKQISDSSRRVAEGASEQASSLQETSASLEESTATVQNNARSATQIKSVAEETNSAAQQGSEEMKTMVETMRLIDESSNNIAATLKTIDEIAFQTNILALNAAVEAARAGEAGAGFAVVADEVRALAQRCAKAARETSNRIDESAQRSEMGLAASERVSEKLSHICGRASEMDRLMSEMAQSSNEQSEGIAQLNCALSQMDQVTQGNAASAEETASATIELDTQTDKMHQMVAELSDILGIETITDGTSNYHRRSNASSSWPTPNRTKSSAEKTVDDAFADSLWN